MKTASKKGTNSGPAIFRPETTMTKAAATSKNRENEDVFSIILYLQLMKHVLRVKNPICAGV
jgi:hypothetical protein